MTGVSGGKLSMSLFRVTVVVVVLAFLLGAHSVSPSAASPARVTTIPDLFVHESDHTPASDRGADSSSGIDVFGNEVDEAVGDYRVDARGDLYERHSPDTEVPKLAPPIG
jgi:hypothetical protein